MAAKDKIKELEEEIISLKERIEDLDEGDTEEKMRERWEKIKSMIGEKREEVYKKAKQSDESLRTYVAGHPYQAIAASMLAGFICGIVMSSKKRVE